MSSPAALPLDPRALFPALKALHFCTLAKPFEMHAAPLSNTLAVDHALKSQLTLLAYASFGGTLEASLGPEAVEQYASLLEHLESPTITSFSATLRSFKLPEDMQLNWGKEGGAHEAWDAWLGAVDKYVQGMSALLARVEASQHREEVAAFNDRVQLAAQRMAEEEAALLVTKMDSRTLKKMHKAAEKERLRREALEDAEGGGAKGKSAKKALKKMSAAVAEGGGGGEAQAQEAEPPSAALLALLSGGGGGGGGGKKHKDKAAGGAPSVPKGGKKAAADAALHPGA